MAGAAAGSAATQPTDALLSIGQVLAKLQGEFPGLTSSKLRFLEVQGIVSPQRTESGYRKFSAADVGRLRTALELQRDHYLPLSVIRDHLDERDASGETGTLPASIHAGSRTYTRAELLEESAAAPQLLNDAVSLGLLAPAESYDQRAVDLLRALVALERHGIDPRHVRALRQSADRDVALVEAALAPLLRRGDARSGARANEIAPQLAARLDDVRRIFVREGLERILPS